jgi:hypothetical protein
LSIFDRYNLFANEKYTKGVNVIEYANADIYQIIDQIASRITIDKSKILKFAPNMKYSALYFTQFHRIPYLSPIVSHIVIINNQKLFEINDYNLD